MIWICALAVTWLAVYLGMRGAFPAQDRAELMHMNRVGRRTVIAMGVMLLAAIVWWLVG